MLQSIQEANKSKEQILDRINVLLKEEEFDEIIIPLRINQRRGTGLNQERNTLTILNNKGGPLKLL